LSCSSILHKNWLIVQDSGRQSSPCKRKQSIPDSDSPPMRLESKIRNNKIEFQTGSRTGYTASFHEKKISHSDGKGKRKAGHAIIQELIWHFSNFIDFLTAKHYTK